MVDCSHFLDEYSDFRDGLLTTERMQTFQAHLDACPSCARYDRVVDQGARVFRGLPEVEPSDDFVLRLQYRLHRIDEEMRPPSRHSSGTSVAFTMAIAAVIGVSAWMPALRERPSVVHLPPVAAHAPHRVEVIQVRFQPRPLFEEVQAPQPHRPTSESNTLFYRFSPVGSYVAHQTSFVLPH